MTNVLHQVSGAEPAAGRRRETGRRRRLAPGFRTAMRTRLIGELYSVTEKLAQSSIFDITRRADSADETQRITENNEEITRREMLYRRKRDIDRALTLVLADPGYGCCEHCEGPIAKARLKALPWARLCLSCQAAEENKEKRLGVH